LCVSITGFWFEWILLENTGFREKELMLAGARLPAAVPEGDVKNYVKPLTALDARSLTY
jgi:hypothetical protein